MRRVHRSQVGNAARECFLAQLPDRCIREPDDRCQDFAALRCRLASPLVQNRRLPGDVPGRLNDLTPQLASLPPSIIAGIVPKAEKYRKRDPDKG